jgi:GNAT superfamily N-acetyltransferase
MNVDLKVEKLRRDHVLEGFDCGKEPLNRFLVRNALQSQQASGSQTYIALAADRVIGYHTLVVGELAPAVVPERVRKGLGPHAVPIMLLARLAVSEDWKGRGIGSALLKDALLRTVQAAEIAGIRAFAVHAKDNEAREFYSRFDFAPSPSDPLHLFLILKDVRAQLR